ncbi:hypothetical protein FKW77_006792 [Venturia effusa]|uniref:Cyclin N-terminal domain-containing protein n=1 Tax=Venturia effusa TaxID=50376 RepID=A0A517L5L7_9PEZI|nr:hypothetical protein FKW77_006792 [Venturia effusa]
MHFATSTSDFSKHLSVSSILLCKLVPQQQLQQQRPNPEQVAAYLARAALDPNTLALAACVLESLSSSFVRSWRKACEKARSPTIATFRSDPLKAELIVLGALAIAQSYLHDTPGNPKWWSKYVSRKTVEARDIAATTNCILQDIDYGLMSFTMDDLEEKKQEMVAEGERGVRSGKAVLNEGQLTPDESPW